MSDEPQPLRLKPRLPSAGGTPSTPPTPPPPPPAPGPAQNQADEAGRLRLKPRLNLSADPQPEADPAPPAPEPFAPPPPPEAIPPPDPVAAAEPQADDALKFKLRPKAAAAPAVPAPPAASDEAPPPPPPMGMPRPPPARIAPTLPPMSVLAAPPPPRGAAEPPAPPGSMPRLSLSTPPDKPGAPKGLQIRVAESQPKTIGGKPVVKPGKPAPVLRKRPALGIVAKAGIAVLVIAFAIGGVFSYRIFFPGPAQVVPIKLPPIARPAKPADTKQSAPDIPSTVAVTSGKPADGQGSIPPQRDAPPAKVDAPASGKDSPAATPVPTSAGNATQSMMAQANITSDVKVNDSPIDTSPAASTAFRQFVASASIGGVFQGSPARALINNRIVRAGQTLDNPLGIIFDRIDANKKIIYFKDTTGAEVSKEY